MKNGDAENSKRRDKPLRSTDSIIRRFEPVLLAVRRSLARRGFIAGKLRMHDVGYPVGFRLNDRKKDHRDREKHGQDQNSETPFLENAVLFPTRPVERGMHGCLHKAAVPVPCIAQGAGYPCELLHIDGTEKARGFGPALLRDKSTVLQPRTFSESPVVAIIDSNHQRTG